MLAAHFIGRSYPSDFGSVTARRPLTALRMASTNVVMLDLQVCRVHLPASVSRPFPTSTPANGNGKHQTHS